jgi:hypothetical protein
MKRPIWINDIYRSRFTPTPEPAPKFTLCLLEAREAVAAGFVPPLLLVLQFTHFLPVLLDSLLGHGDLLSEGK